MTSAIDRLRNLPEAFTLAAFRRLTGLSENAAAVCLHRWKTKDLIEPAGERAGIYFNKLKTPQPDTALRIEALLYEYPSAILCGESVLHAAGWITQVPAQLTVAVLLRPTYVSFRGFEIRGRPLSWFTAVHADVSAHGNDRVYGMRALPPALALVDLYGDPEAWHPDPDDLDVPPDQAGAMLSGSERLRIPLPKSLRDAMSRSARKPS
ncbi:MAG TPA: hypothetical protein VGG63_13895 [Steroidobacteraceae bacterium]